MKATRERIINAAKDLFEQNGYAATTTRAIAEHAGVSEVTLFRHFETKRNLFEQTVHSCMHPYKLIEYLKNNAQYDLEKDLTQIAHNMLQTYKENLPMFRMLHKDKMRHSGPEMHAKKKEHGAITMLTEYFSTMKKLGKISEDPEMCTIFLHTNITGYFFRVYFSKHQSDIDDQYFTWMLEKVISVLKVDN